MIGTGPAESAAGARTWVGTSWKMTKSRAQAEAYATALTSRLSALPPHVELFVLPAFPHIEAVARILRRSRVRVGAQNLHWAESGPFTGEVSAPMVAEVGATIAEIGHSERRALFGESDETVGLKVAAAQRHGLTPIVCVGEPWSVREAGAAEAFVASQVRAALAESLPGADIWFAYEPVWAIGQHGRPATPDQAQAVHAVIRETLVALLGERGSRVPVLYGGSVSPDNAAGFVSAPSVDGVFVGRAAWSVEGLLAVAQVVAKATVDQVPSRRDP